MRRLSRGMLLVFLAVCVSAGAETLVNDYISLLVDDFAQRVTSFLTVKGSEHYYSDDGHLLLHQKSPSRTCLMVAIDGKYLKYGLVGRKIVLMKKTANRLYSENDINKITVSQQIEIVNGLTSGLQDNLRLTFTVRNNDAASHSVGLRYLIDTFNGQMDDGPFYLPAVGTVPGERQITDVPDYFFSADDVSEPYNQFQVVFGKECLTKPDRLIFANCDKINYEPWDFPAVSSSSFRLDDNSMSDSAVALFWDPKELAPGAEMKVAFEMGVFDSRYFRGDVVELSVGIPRMVTNSRVIAVSVLIKNSDGFRTLSDMKPVLTLPEGIILAADNVAGSIPEILPKSGHFIYYYLNFGDIPEGKYNLKINTTGKIGKSFTVNEFIQSFLAGPR